MVVSVDVRGDQRFIIYAEFRDCTDYTPSCSGIHHFQSCDMP